MSNALVCCVASTLPDDLKLKNQIAKCNQDAFALDLCNLFILQHISVSQMCVSGDTLSFNGMKVR